MLCQWSYLARTWKINFIPCEMKKISLGLYSESLNVNLNLTRGKLLFPINILDLSERVELGISSSQGGSLTCRGCLQAPIFLTKHSNQLTPEV